jgi:hypothetical protein
VLLPLGLLSYLLYRLASPSKPDYIFPYSYDPSSTPPQQLAGTGGASSRGRVAAVDTKATEKLFETLVKVPEEEVGKIAICASIHNEGRFISEWLLYVRLSSLSQSTGDEC